MCYEICFFPTDDYMLVSVIYFSYSLLTQYITTHQYILLLRLSLKF